MGPQAKSFFLAVLAASVAHGEMLINRASAPWNALDDAALRAAAAVALTNVAETVTAKAMTPASGDKRDYMSFGPYWWPDPTKPDGLPYIRRDGETNPASLTDSDRKRLERMVDDVEILAAAAKRFGDRAAGQEAVRKLRVFFLDPQTAMNPNLNYGQAVPGRCAGRCIGIIDTRYLANRLPDALSVLEETGDLASADRAGLRTWFGKYVDWLTTSGIGLDESREHNNHAVSWDLQVVVFYHLSGRDDRAREVLRKVLTRRVATQIEPDGAQPHELARTRSLTYATMNATLFGELALMGERLGVDLWTAETPDGRSIRKAVAWLKPYWDRTKPWTRKQITPVDWQTIGRDIRAIDQHFENKPAAPVAGDSHVPCSGRQ